jgi:Bacteriophage probable baseplate hub protein
MDGPEVLPVDVYQNQDFYVPAFVVKVGEKQDLTEANDVLSITYTDSLTEIDSFDMTVSNWDPDTRQFKYSDKSTFNPWKNVELRMGYLGSGKKKDELQRMLIGEITTLAPSFPASGGPTLTVRGLNLIHRFRLEQETHAFLKQNSAGKNGWTDTEIAEFLVKRIAEKIRKTSPALKLELAPADIKANKAREEKLRYPFLLMNNQYPIVFLMERARRIGYELTMDYIKGQHQVIFHFRPTSEVVRRTYILEWGVSLISFQPTLRTAGQVSKVTVRGWSPKTKEPIVGTATRKDIKDEKVVDPSAVGLNDPQTAQEVTVDLPISSKDEAKRQAKDILRKQATELITAKGKTIGVPDLRAGVKVQIKGLGRFSGTYVITDTTHTIGDGGYTTDFGARMEGSLG